MRRSSRHTAVGICSAVLLLLLHWPPARAAAAAAVAAPASAAARASPARDPVETARAALRTLQFDKAVAALRPAAEAGNAKAESLLGLIYLNGVGVAADPARARALLQSAAEGGDGTAAYVLAGELARDPRSEPGAVRGWLERAAQLGYARAAAALKADHPLFEREPIAEGDTALYGAWVIDCARRNDARELRRLGTASAGVRDAFDRTALMHAADVGAADASEVLLGLGADSRAADRFGTTALMLAAEHGDTRISTMLLAHNADPDAVDIEQRSAAFYAARTNRAAMIELLQQAGGHIGSPDSRGYSALDVAVAAGAGDAAARLRSFGAKAFVVSGKSGRQSGKFDPAHPGEIYRGWQELALAIARDDAADAQRLLGAGVDPNLRLPQGDTLLQVAADAHAFNCLAVLLARGADATAPDHSGHSVLWLAVTHEDTALVNALLTDGVKPDTHAPHEEPALFAAIRASHLEQVQRLIESGTGVDCANADGRTSLMIAAAAGDIELVRALLARHANPNVPDRRHRTALWYAAWSGTSDTVAALLSRGADQEIADADGVSALHAAAAHGKTGVVARLLAGDSRLNRRTAAGDTPLLLAAATGQEEAVNVLLSKSAALDLQNKAGDTALIAASRGGYTAICHALLQAGADRGLRNGVRISAADIATRRGFATLARELATRT